MVDLFSHTMSKVLSNESISNMIQDPQVNLYNSMRDRITIETAITQARAVIQISMDDPISPSVIPFRVTFTSSDGAAAVKLLSRMTASLIQIQLDPLPALAVNSDADFEARIGNPPASMADLEPRRKIPGRVTLEPLELPMAATREFPNPIIFTLTGGFLGLLLAFPVRARLAA
jgi:hypothetical protein